MSKNKTTMDDLLFELFDRVLDKSISSSLDTGQSPLFLSLLECDPNQNMLKLFFLDFSSELEMATANQPTLINNIVNSWIENKSNIKNAVQNAIVQLGMIAFEKHLRERTYALLTLINNVNGEKIVYSHFYENIKRVWCQVTIKGTYCPREIELVCALVNNGDLAIVNDIEMRNIKTTFMVAACLSEAYKKIKGTSRGSIKFATKELEKLALLKESPVIYINNKDDWVSVFNKKHDTTLSLAWNAFTINMIEPVYDHIKKLFSTNKSMPDDNELGKNIRKTLNTQHYKALISNLVQMINNL